MTLLEIQNKFNTHLKCIRHLEAVRWGAKPICIYCGSDGTSERDKHKRHKGNDYKTPRYHCNSCNRDFSVLTGTIFEHSKLPLPKWFALISLMLNARKGISAKQIQRDLGLTYKTAWFCAMRVRCAMLDQATMLEGIVEIDEAYVGGKPRHRKGDDNEARLGYVSWKGDRPYIDKRKFNKGRATDDKIMVVGMVERGGKGRVTLKVQDGLTGADLFKLLKRYVKTDSATIMTDEFKAYKVLDKTMTHYSVNHSKKEYVKYIKGIKDYISTNTIEGVFSILKNSIRGQYHVLSKKYLPFYLAELAYKYNRRNLKGKNEAFKQTIENAVSDEKCEVNYKPKALPTFLAYRNKKQKDCSQPQPECVPAVNKEQKLALAEKKRSRAKEYKRLKMLKGGIVKQESDDPIIPYLI